LLSIKVKSGIDLTGSNPGIRMLGKNDNHLCYQVIAMVFDTILLAVNRSGK